MTQTKAELLQTRHQGDIRLGDADSSHYVGFKAPATVSSSLVWTLPAADGSANQFLKTNASGVLSWGTVDTSTLMPLGGGTFTGDVSFASNSISNAVNWSKAANIFQVRDATKLTFGNSNDLEIFHDGNNSYIDDISGTGALKIRTNQLLLQNNSGDENYLIANSNGQVELYHNNVKKIETSAAGISITGALTVSTDATITGNLTVSGTTTTINTQTLDVEDKNVVIGKVSSPSDTTADGGGWTLKGATDKTFNWVNATDAWTSSEHIHLIDNKKLFVGGASGTTDGLEIVHNGSNSILNDSVTGTLQLQLGGSTKLEVQSGGINVTGAINVNGSALSTAPQITANADGSISVGDAVLIQANGTVKKIENTTTSANFAYRNVATLNSETSQYVQIAVDPRTANRWAITYNDDVGTKYTQLKVITRSGTTITESSWHRVSNETNVMYSAPCWDPAADNRIIVFDQRGSNNKAQLVTFTGSAGSESFTNHTAFTMHSSYWTEPWENARTLPLPLGNTGYFLFNYWDNNQIRTKLILLSGNTISAGSSGVQILITGSTAMGGFAINPEDPTKGFVTYKNSSNKWCVRPITFGGSGSTRTTTLGSEEQLSTDDVAGNNPFLRLVYVDGDHFVANCKMNNGSSVWGAHTILVKYVGTTYTKSPIVLPPTNLTGALAGGNQPEFGSLSNNLTTDPKTLVMCNTYSGGGTYAGQAMSNIGTVNTDNMTISWSNQVQIDAGNTNDLYYVNIAQSSGAEQPTVLIYTKSGTPYVHAQLYLSGSTSSNLSDRFIGFSSAGYTNGQAATINVIGATTTQSSLTPASDYYVTKTGALSTTADTPSVKAGVAVSSTKLLIKGH